MTSPTYIVVRPIAPGDQKQIKQIVRKGTMSPLNSFYLAAVTQEITIQVCVILSGIIFIVLEVPFHLCWISFPLVAALLYIAIYLGYLKRLSVLSRYQHKGVAQELCTAAFQHAMDNNYRAVELRISQSHLQARSFFDKQEWKMTSSHNKTYLWFFTVGFFVLRKACIRQQT